jgi:hypothetical protein
MNLCRREFWTDAINTDAIHYVTSFLRDECCIRDGDFKGLTLRITLHSEQNYFTMKAIFKIMRYNDSLQLQVFLR